MSVGTWWALGRVVIYSPSFQLTKGKENQFTSILMLLFIIYPLKFRRLPTLLIILCDRCTFRQTEQNY